jgi:hypothetical protein
MPLEKSPSSASLGGLSVVVVGNDALIEALPAHPIQLSLACLAAGYDLAVPASWGDELTAEASVRALAERGGEPAVLCTCPIVQQRLTGAGRELDPMLVGALAPPIAVARYLRILYPARIGHLAYVGACPAARGVDYDATFLPDEFLTLLRGSGIDPLGQPEYYDQVLPPDRRRFVSLPGGCPAPEVLWHRCNERSLVSLEGVDVTVELAQHLLTRQPVLVDLAPTMGCACCGVTPTTLGRAARIAVMSIEPPRATSPVIETLDPSLLDPPPLSDAASHGPTGPGSGPSETGPPAAPPDEPGAPEATPDESRRRLARPPLAVTPPGALRIVSSSVSVEHEVSYPRHPEGTESHTALRGAGARARLERS